MRKNVVFVEHDERACHFYFTCQSRCKNVYFWCFYNIMELIIFQLLPAAGKYIFLLRLKCAKMQVNA
ncbi:hypothetical protein DKT12_24260 [Salmonella enterica subsp. enterica serovar Hvittingfoss]|nr:hypothetical protein [Salmonella enterica]EBU6875993.1 hypothetical protein [Salmonella enterica subsp. enterica serovar Hvittingfoss]